jgi:hypothetical protein
MNPFSVKFLANCRPVVLQNKDFNVLSIVTGKDTLVIMRLSQL